MPRFDGGRSPGESAPHEEGARATGMVNGNMDSGAGTDPGDDEIDFDRVFDGAVAATADDEHAAEAATGHGDAIVPTETAEEADERDEAEADAMRIAILKSDPRMDPDLARAITDLLRHNGSDIHLVCRAFPRIRVDGALRVVRGTGRWTDKRMMESIRHMVDEEQLSEYERTHELDFALSVGDPADPTARFRVNAYHDNNGACLAMRIIPTVIRSVAQLGLPEGLEDTALLPRGLVLVCGPTGSGKSTTLAAIIDHANELRDDHIITVEDPIEFLYHHKRCIVNQREVGRDTPSFAEALKRALREDPDIIEIGEMRDRETISTAITAAETGHLVFGTLHTQDAPQTIDRIINVFPAEEQEQVAMMLSMSLKAVVVQTLIPRIGGGRACATEVMFNTPAVANLIRSHKTDQIGTQLQTGRREGMHTMDQSLSELVNSGAITPEDALEHSQNRKTLRDILGLPPEDEDGATERTAL